MRRRYAMPEDASFLNCVSQCRELNHVTRYPVMDIKEGLHLFGQLSRAPVSEPRWFLVLAEEQSIYRHRNEPPNRLPRKAEDPLFWRDPLLVEGLCSQQQRRLSRRNLVSRQVEGLVRMICISRHIPCHHHSLPHRFSGLTTPCQ